MDVPLRAAWRVAYRTERPERPTTEGLLEPGVDAIPVRIAIIQNGFVTGWDDGALGFEDDAVWFSGHATSFRIVAPDVWRFAYRPGDVERMKPGRLADEGLPLRHPSREIRVRMAVLKVASRRNWEDRLRVDYEIRRLMTRPTGSGESQYPPLVVRPGAKVVEVAAWDSPVNMALKASRRDPLTVFLRTVGRDRELQNLRRSLDEEALS